MTVPVAGLPGPLVTFLDALEQRIALLEAPQGPQRTFRIASGSLSVASAKANGGCCVVLTDLKTFATSDGAHWYRADTGALIV